jgi:hypothetical protein
MIDASEAVIWVNVEARLIMVWQHSQGCPDERHRLRRWTGPGHWVDPIGAAYSEWRKMKNPVRMRLMTETAIDLAMQGIPLKDILIAFAQVTEFRALGSESYPMARALTSALLGRCLEPNTMSFEELLETYQPATAEAEAGKASA